MICGIPAQERHPYDSDSNPRPAADGHEEHDVGQHFTRKPASRGAKCGTNCELAATRMQLREQKLRGVDTRDDKDKNHACQQADEHLLNIPN